MGIRGQEQRPSPDHGGTEGFWSDRRPWREKALDRRASGVIRTRLAGMFFKDARPGAKETAIREAALKPRLIAEYVQQWLPDRPSDAHCLSELQLDRGFSEVAAKLFLRVFDDTISYANLKNSDNLSPVLEQEENPLESAVEGPAPMSAAVRQRSPQPMEPQTTGGSALHSLWPSIWVRSASPGHSTLPDRLKRMK